MDVARMKRLSALLQAPDAAMWGPEIEWSDTTLLWHGYFYTAPVGSVSGTKRSVTCGHRRDKVARAVERAMRKHNRQRRRSGMPNLPVIQDPRSSPLDEKDQFPNHKPERGQQA